MKPGLKRWLEIDLIGMNNLWDEVDQIEILFQQYRTYGVLKRAVWKSDHETDDCKRGKGNTILVLWTREETYRFKEDTVFYMDIRPVLKNGLDIPVEPVPICMTWTLFKEERDG